MRLRDMEAKLPADQFWHPKPCCQKRTPILGVRFWQLGFGGPKLICWEFSLQIGGAGLFFTYQTCANPFIVVAAQKNQCRAKFQRPGTNVKFWQIISGG